MKLKTFYNRHDDLLLKHIFCDLFLLTFKQACSWSRPYKLLSLYLWYDYFLIIWPFSTYNSRLSLGLISSIKAFSRPQWPSSFTLTDLFTSYISYSFIPQLNCKCLEEREFLCISLHFLWHLIQYLYMVDFHFIFID